MSVSMFFTIVGLLAMLMMAIVAIGSGAKWPIERLNEEWLRFIFQAFLACLGITLAAVGFSNPFWLIISPGGIGIAIFALFAIRAKTQKRIWILTGISCSIVPILLAFLFLGSKR